MAGKEISQLEPASPLSGAEVLPGDQQGSTVKITAQHIADLASMAAQVVGGDLTGQLPNPSLATIGSAAGPVGDGTHVATVTIDAKGRVTGLTSTAITASGADKLGLTPTAVKTANYSAAVGDLVPCDTTSGSFTVTLPSGPADGSVIAVKTVIKGASNTITIAAAGSDVFNKAAGSTSLTMARVLQSVLLQYRASSAIWYVVTTDPALVIGTDVQAWNARLDTFAAASDTGSGNYVRATSPAFTTPTGIVATDIASGTFAIGRIPTGTTSTTVPVGGVITGATTGDASHSLAVTYNNAGQLTAVTSNSIAIAESQVTNLVTDLAAKAPLASPTFTGTVTLPAATVTLAQQVNAAANSIRGNNTGSAATPLDLTVAQTKTLLNYVAADIPTLAPLASPTFTGTLSAATGSFSSTVSSTGLAVSGSAGVTATGAAFGLDFTATEYGGIPGALLRRAQGTAGSETQVLSTQTMGSLTFAGWNNTSAGYLNSASIAAVAEQDFTTTGFRGTKLQISTAPSSVNGGALVRLIVDNAGKVYVGSSTSATTSIDQSGNTLLGGTLGVTGTLSGAAITATSSVLSSSATGGVGYSTGAGGAVTQLTSKSTAFPTISKTCGTLTWNNAALASDTTVTSASSTNTAIAATDTVVFTHISGGTLGAYNMTCTPAAGTWTLTLRNLHSGSLSEAPVFAFAIIKAVTA